MSNISMQRYLVTQKSVPEGLSRQVTVYGQGPDFDKAFNMNVAIGQYLPADDPRKPRAFAVLSIKVHQELLEP